MTAGVITVVSTLVGTLIFTIPQLLWITIISTIGGVVGLTADCPPENVMQRRPYLKQQPLISMAMWKMILCQALYQVLSILTIHYVGWAIFEKSGIEQINDLQSLVFNIYVWMQIFNQHNCRRVDNNINIHQQGLMHSLWFILAQVMMIVGQVVIITVGGSAFNTKPLNGYQWAWSILFGFLTLPLGIMIRQIPDDLVFCLFQILLRAYRAVLGWILSFVPEFLRRSHEDGSLSVRAEPRRWMLTTGSSLLTPISYRLCQSHGDVEASGCTSEDQTPRKPTVMSAPLRRARKQLQERVLRRKHSREEVDLHGMVEYVRRRPLGSNEVTRGVDVHPETGRNDPVLMSSIGVDGASDPPSQDPEIIRMLSLRARK